MDNFPRVALFALPVARHWSGLHRCLHGPSGRLSGNDARIDSFRSSVISPMLSDGNSCTQAASYCSNRRLGHAIVAPAKPIAVRQRLRRDQYRHDGPAVAALMEILEIKRLVDNLIDGETIILLGACLNIQGRKPPQPPSMSIALLKRHQ
jgi:hypothetical protein